MQAVVYFEDAYGVGFESRLGGRRLGARLLVPTLPPPPARVELGLEGALETEADAYKRSVVSVRGRKRKKAIIMRIAHVPPYL